MSFLNPPAVTPKLSVNIAALVALRDMRPASRAFDMRYFPQAAEEAGAEAIRIGVDTISLRQKRTEVDAVMNAVTEVHLTMPLTREMIDFAGMVRPHSVYFAATDGKHEAVLSDASLHLMSEAVAQLQQRSVHVVLVLDPATSQLQQLADSGASTVEFTIHETAWGDAVNQDLLRAALRAAVIDAKRLGLDVHLAHGIDYSNVNQFAALGDIAQLTIGHAIAARAMVVGWSTAVREMKAALISASVTESAPSMPRSDARVNV